ncbi:MAG: lytic murein transglycosylase [Desulfovibrio sp.]|nr:lytic murein transglycosylase [Desulfovibrio sp.]
MVVLRHVLFGQSRSFIVKNLISVVVLSWLCFPASLFAYEAQSFSSLAPRWQYLVNRLAQDGLSDPAVVALFASLPATHTQSPMGRKILALYKKKFFPSRTIKKTDYYKGVVSEKNARTCKDYLEEHRASFEKAWERYSVPPAIAVSLLFVETRLGTVLADVPENAFYTLASMAASRTPHDIASWLPKMRGYKKRLDWIEKTMRARAEWAYTETKALVQYMMANAIDPKALPSSIYGAVGLCQFMPSNIALYGADGDGDGRIDLFQIEDATMSLAKYLAKHGWKRDLTRDQQHALLMKYNHSKMYANTILALADQIMLLDSKKP